MSTVSNSNSPYNGLPPEAFWRTGVVDQPLPLIENLYVRKFAISKTDRIATAGSCFAQHIARHLRGKGYNVLDVEPPPPGLSGEEAQRFGYNLYSARYGNIYVVRQLLQLLLESRGRHAPADWIWERDGRYFDALRPSVEPNGLESPEEVIAHRERHLTAVRRMVKSANVFVFTLGLTEAWVHRNSGTVYATAPETIAGKYDPGEHMFKNFTFAELYNDFVLVRRLLKRGRPDLRFVVTVSPVPLTATASGDHVLSATTYSKSVLRAVAGQLSKDFEDIDYFPSFDLISTPPSRGAFYEANLRSVKDVGVQAAMQAFLSQHDEAEGPSLEPTELREARRPVDDEADDNLVCEELLLEAFSK